jgi:hypothetical protein
MTIRLEITIYDEGLLDSNSLVRFLERLDRTCRNAAVIATIRIAGEFDLPSSLVQLACLRIWTQDESLFWIEELQSGSKIFKGKILAGALISMVLTSTIGESIKEGWKQTASHAYIVKSVPKMEDYFIQEFRKLFEGEQQPADDRLYVEPVAIQRDEDQMTLEVRVFQKRSHPADH